MNTIISFHKGDRDQAIRLANWIRELGQPAGHRFFLMTRQELQHPGILPTGWEWMTDWDKVDTQWSHGVSDARGPNSVWRACAREIMRLKAGPWLWLEPDAVPCRPDWLELIDAEYKMCAKPFMGGKAPKGNRMSGIGVYAENTPWIITDAFCCDPVAFDAAKGGVEILARAHITPLICDQFRCAPFTSQADFDARVPRNAAIHHGDKTDSIYQFLRSRIQRERGGEIQSAPVAAAEPSAALPTTENTQDDAPFLQGVRSRLDWIEQRAISGFAKMHLRTELEKRGLSTIVKAPLRKRRKKAH